MHVGIKYPCEQCDFQANQKASLTRHRQSVHMGRKYTCQECGKQFNVKISLTKHEKQWEHEKLGYLE